MKRYRFSNFYIDGTRGILRNNKLPPSILEKERDQLKSHIILKYGQNDADGKLERYLEYDPPNICVISEYLGLLHDIADTYVFGKYYPALTGAASLGERIYNILILKLREYHKGHALYKTIYNKESIQDWHEAIDILAQWNIIDSETEASYRRLAILRKNSVHFGDIPNIRKSAIDALNIIMEITNKLFGLKSDFFFWCPGELYVKKEKETLPFVQEFILPTCALLGYKHTTEGTLDSSGMVMHYLDSNEYQTKEISDEEFLQLRTDWGRTGKNSE